METLGVGKRSISSTDSENVRPHHDRNDFAMARNRDVFPSFHPIEKIRQTGPRLADGHR